jgi:hypothetical protein
MSVQILDYYPPLTIKEFIKDYRVGELFYSWIVGPVGSGKTTGLFMKLVYMAGLQEPSPDGIRRTRAVIVRNTLPMLKDTTLVSWGYWFKDGQAGYWNATDKIFTIRYADIECEVLFRPLDTPEDVRRVLSLEINFAIIDEFVEIPKAIVDALSARCGRYKQPDGTPVTVWGMWGSSNPSTEDNWWFDYLHAPFMRKFKNGRYAPREVSIGHNGGPSLDFEEEDETSYIATYFHQPSALTMEAENINNLPGKRGYYLNQIKGKSSIWVKQFVEAEWGFSVSGQAVVTSFRPHIHISPYELAPNPYFPLVVGLDPGITGSAMVLGQMDFDGRVKILHELVQSGMGAERLISERLKPLLKARFSMIRKIIIAPDPASGSRTPTDESTVAKEFKKHFDVEIETNNRLPLRLNAYDHYCNTLVGGEPALQIDPIHCPELIRALKGGWRFASDVKKDILKGATPEKNRYSHVGDGGGYLLRFFHRDMQKERKYGMNVGTMATRRMRSSMPTPSLGSYHAR